MFSPALGRTIGKRVLQFQQSKSKFLLKPATYVTNLFLLIYILIGFLLLFRLFVALLKLYAA